MDTKRLIHEHRKKIAVLKMIENAELKFQNHIKMVTLGLNLNDNLNKAKRIISIQDRLINYYYKL
jgi:aspartate carbamoyltransferase regulatory subunit